MAKPESKEKQAKTTGTAASQDLWDRGQPKPHQLEAVLTESQRNRWKSMLGKPMPIEALFDL